MSEETTQIKNQDDSIELSPEGNNVSIDEALQEAVGYRGSKELNPEQRPLEMINKDQYSNEQIDNMLLTSPEIIMTDEQIKEQEEFVAEQEKEEKDAENNEPKDDEKPEEKIEENNETGDKKEPGSGEPSTEGKTEGNKDILEFYKSTGLTQNEFDSLNEAAQESIVNLYDGKKDNTGETEKVRNEFSQYKQSINKTFEDSYISARLREMQNGETLIPKSIPSLTNEEYEAVISAEDTALADKAITDIINKRIEPFVKNSWSQHEKNFINQQNQNKTYKILNEIGKVDTEFAFDGDISGMNEQHPKFGEFQNTIGKITNYLIQKGENFATISRKEPKEILAAYNTATGRSDARDKQIASNVRKELLSNLRNPRKAVDGQTKAKTVRSSVKPGHSRTNAGNLSKENIVKQMLDGDFNYYENVLGPRAEGDQKLTTFMQVIWNEYTKQENMK